MINITFKNTLQSSQILYLNMCILQHEIKKKILRKNAYASVMISFTKSAKTFSKAAYSDETLEYRDLSKRRLVRLLTKQKVFFFLNTFYFEAQFRTKMHGSSILMKNIQPFGRHNVNVASMRRKYHPKSTRHLHFEHQSNLVLVTVQMSSCE